MVDAEMINVEILGEEFKKGLYAGKEMLDKLGKGNEENYKTLTSVAMHILAAIILSHKLYPEEKISDIHNLVDRLSKEFYGYFDKTYIYLLAKDVLDSIFDSFDKNIAYSSINKEVLGNFYESILLYEGEIKKENARKEFGIYYTPKTIADDILSHIPIEYVDVNNRVILDATCGCGNFLISAYKRLNEMLPFKWNSEKRHDYLTKMIIGMDKDKFAQETARLALLLYSFPESNNWNVKCNDLLKIKNIKNAEAPNLIVGNLLFRQEEEGKQVATNLLAKYIGLVKTGGYLGIILPENFLRSQSSKKIINARRKLLDDFDILEIWRLPSVIFNSYCDACIIIARKFLYPLENPVKVRIMSRSDFSTEIYLKNNKVSLEFFIESKSQWMCSKNYVIDILPKYKTDGNAMVCDPHEEYMARIPHVNTWSITGEVIEIDFKNMILKAEFVELDGIKSVRITDNLPGWLIRKGSCFKAEIQEELMAEGVIEILNPKPLDYTYMSDEEIHNYIKNNILSRGVLV